MNFVKKILNKINYLFFPQYLLAKKPLETKEFYLKIFHDSIKNKNKKLEEILLKKKLYIDHKWFEELALHTQVTIKKSKINYYHGKLLYSYLGNYLKDNKFDFINILETGTARGFSSICMSKCLLDYNQQGKIVTIDVLPHNIKMYWNCIDDHVSKKTRNELLEPWKNELKNIDFLTGRTRKVLKKIKSERINFAFLDAAHNYSDVINEFCFVEKRQQKNDIIFFDDVTPSMFEGVRKAIEFIKKNANYDIEEISASEERGYAIATKL
jgi:hypothetical protein